jgi:hypothetical protein
VKNEWSSNTTSLYAFMKLTETTLPSHFSLQVISINEIFVKNYTVYNLVVNNSSILFFAQNLVSNVFFFIIQDIFSPRSYSISFQEL